MFLMVGLEIVLHFQRNDFEGAYGWCHVALRELLRHSDGLPNRWFCRSDLPRVQLKSNWTVGKKLLATDSKTVWKNRLILSKARLIFFNGCFANWIISKELTLKEFLYDVMLCSGNWSALQMALRADHFVDWTFRESNRTVDEKLLASDGIAVT